MKDEKNKVTYEPFKKFADEKWKIIEKFWKKSAFSNNHAKHLDGLKFDAWENAPLDYYDLDLVPIVFLHGLTSSGSLHYGYSAELASHGYIVFNLDFIDGSGGYTEL